MDNVELEGSNKFFAKKFCSQTTSTSSEVDAEVLRFTSTVDPIVEDNAIALIGPTSLQVVDNEVVHDAKRNASDLRQLACAFFVDSILSSVPKSKRKNAQKEIVEVMNRLNIVSSEYFSNTFSTARRPLSLLISKFVIQTCQQGSPISFSPSIDSPLSLSNLSLINSRYFTDFEEIAHLGSGGFGKVFKVRSRIDNQLYAIKQIRLMKSLSFAKMLSECRYHASLQNEYVVRYHNAWVEFEPAVSTSVTPVAAGNQKLYQSSSFSSFHSQSPSLGENRENMMMQQKRFLSNELSTVSLNGDSTTPNTTSNGCHSKFWRKPVRKGIDTSNDSFSENRNMSDDTMPEMESSIGSSIQFVLDDDSSDNDETQNSLAEIKQQRDLTNQSMVLWPSMDYAQSSVSSLAVTTNTDAPKNVRKSLSTPSFLPTHSNLRQNISTDNEIADLGIPVLYIQMELCGSTLERYLKERHEFNMEFNEIIVLGLLSAVDFLHKNRLIHRDIKPSNVLLKRRSGRTYALLGDFGLTREITCFQKSTNVQEEYNNVCRVNDVLANDSSQLTNGIGTALYAAPEQIASRDYTSSVDIYSSGIVFYELFQLFSTAMERAVTLSSLRKSARTNEKFRLLWPEISTLIEKMVPIEPALRFTASQLLVEFKCCAENYRRKSNLRMQQYEEGTPQFTELSIPQTGDGCEGSNNIAKCTNIESSHSSSANDTNEILQLRKRNAELELEVKALRAVLDKLQK